MRNLLAHLAHEVVRPRRGGFVCKPGFERAGAAQIGRRHRRGEGGGAEDHRVGGSGESDRGAEQGFDPGAAGRADVLELDRLGRPRDAQHPAQQGHEHADREFRVLPALHDPPVADTGSRGARRYLPVQGQRGMLLQGGEEAAERGERGGEGGGGEREVADVAERVGGAGEAETQAKRIDAGLARRLLEQVAIGDERQAAVRMGEGIGGEAGGGEDAPGGSTVRGDEGGDAGGGDGLDAGQGRIGDRGVSWCHATPPLRAGASAVSRFRLAGAESLTQAHEAIAQLMAYI